jgi:5-methylcytosine-specific restriction endonuclease McrA
MKFPKPCLDCGTLSLGNRCPTHQAVIDNQTNIRRAAIKATTGQYSGSYKRRAKEVRDTAIICWLCGQGARPNDPWQADHVNPAEHGDTAQLLPAHKSCNSSRGNKEKKPF